MSEANLKMFDLYDELRKVIAALAEHQVDYALCGGLAMAIDSLQKDSNDASS